jgi:3',5'-cyclic AMP phosphodiesterase CpdA
MTGRRLPPLDRIERRDLLRLLSFGGIAFASGLAGCTGAATRPPDDPRGAPKATPPLAPMEDFFFLQLSDTNPDPQAGLREMVAAISASATKPDLVVFTGDLTHDTEDATKRRDRMKSFRDVVSKLDVRDVRFLPGEHDAGKDRGEAYREIFGEPHWSFDHKGVHFVALDNVSDPGSMIGEAQLSWLERDLASIALATPVVVLAHRPLFELYPPWDWTTSDGARAIEILAAHGHATVFFGHIHQEHHHTTEANGVAIEHHAARSLVFPLPAPGSVPKKAPLPWDANVADHGLGYRSIGEHEGALTIAEHPLTTKAVG